MAEAGIDIALAPLTTLKLGGPAERLVRVTDTAELITLVQAADAEREPLFFLAGGSNVVIADQGVPGTTFWIQTTGIDETELDDGRVSLTVAAGENWDDLVSRTVESGLCGIECLSGIPGTVGATPIQNVGAYGQEVAQTIAQVRTWDRETQTVRTFAAADCAFTYRHSLFKASSRYVVLDVAFQLTLADLSAPIAYADLAAGLDVPLGTRVPLADAREAVLAQRRRRGMVLDAEDHDTWSCGSFFTNPILGARAFERLVARVHERLGADVEPPRYPGGDGIKTSAAWLIERAGFGKGFGGAREAGLSGLAALSTKHTLAVTNRGAASVADILALARTVRDGVQDAFGVALVNEPVFVGHDL